MKTGLQRQEKRRIMRKFILIVVFALSVMGTMVSEAFAEPVCRNDARGYSDCRGVIVKGISVGDENSVRTDILYQAPNCEVERGDSIVVDKDSPDLYTALLSAFSSKTPLTIGFVPRDPRVNDPRQICKVIFIQLAH